MDAGSNNGELLLLGREFKIVPDASNPDFEAQTTDHLLKALKLINSMPEGWCLIEATVFFDTKRQPVSVKFPNSDVLNLDVEKAEGKIRKLIRTEMVRLYGTEGA